MDLSPSIKSIAFHYTFVKWDIGTIIEQTCAFHHHRALCGFDGEKNSQICRPGHNKDNQCLHHDWMVGSPKNLQYFGQSVALSSDRKYVMMSKIPALFLGLHQPWIALVNKFIVFILFVLCRSCAAVGRALSFSCLSFLDPCYLFCGYDDDSVENFPFSHILKEEHLLFSFLRPLLSFQAMTLNISGSFENVSPVLFLAW